MLKVLSAPTALRDFPGDTVDTPFLMTITGNLADGTPFAQSFDDDDASTEVDLQPGTYVGVVSKLGVSSLPSAPLTIDVPTTVTLSVPDPAQPATFA